MNRWYWDWETLHIFILSLVCLGLMFIIVHQDDTIQQQHKLIQTFRQDKACMHDPR